MKGVFKENLEKPERELSTRESVLITFGRIWKSTLKESFEFVPLYPAVNQAEVWQSDSQDTAMVVTACSATSDKK